MIQFVLGVAVTAASIAYVGYKYHSAKAALAAVKAEVAKLEVELRAGLFAAVGEADVKAKSAAAAVVARIKSLL